MLTVCTSQQARPTQRMWHAANTWNHIPKEGAAVPANANCASKCKIVHPTGSEGLQPASMECVAATLLQAWTRTGPMLTEAPLGE